MFRNDLSLSLFPVGGLRLVLLDLEGVVCSVVREAVGHVAPRVRLGEVKWW